MLKSSSKKQKKGQGFNNPISVLISVTLLGTFAVFAPFNVSFFDSININRILPSFYTPKSISIIPEPSFTSDQNYWDENCTHGWTSDVTCDAIVSRVQSCLVNNSSLYCSAYETYMKQSLQQQPLLCNSLHVQSTNDLIADKNIDIGFSDILKIFENQEPVLQTILQHRLLILDDSGGIRTLNQLLKRQLLCR